MLSNESLNTENPYAAPQAELDKTRRKIVYINKFNGRLAFWSGLAIGVVLLFLYLPEVHTDRTIPRTTTDYVRAYCVITVVSVVIGLYLGLVSGTPITQKAADSEDEEPQTDVPAK